MTRPLRIALVAPLFESVPPKAYGGTERIVATLANELTWAGHEVTLFATADSVVDAELVPCRSRPIGVGQSDTTEAADHIMAFLEVRKRLADFDIVHFHTRFSHFPFFTDIAARSVTTCHNRVDLPTLSGFYRCFDAFPLIAVSDSQRRSQPEANWRATIHHGLPHDAFPPPSGTSREGDYLLFLGRICPEKGIRDAIHIARDAGRSLKIAARINDLDRDYYHNSVAHMIDGRQIEFLGEVDHREKIRLLRNAQGLLFPIGWPEPFGLVMIEAMACGTPVIAYPSGSVPEVIEDGRTGFVVGSRSAAVEAVDKLDSLDRSVIRTEFEARFSAERMARDHIALYRRLADRDRSAKVASAVSDRLREAAADMEQRMVPEVPSVSPPPRVRGTGEPRR